MMEYTSLKGFEEFMAERDLVPEEHRSFYVNWVRRFLNSEFGSSELEERDKVECFAGQLARDSSVKDWQHRQALQAVSLFLDVYLKEEGNGREVLGKGEARSRQDDGGTGEAEEALRQMIKLLRLRHYAYRTEQTYVEWVGRYLKYAGRQGLAWDDPASVRVFLSYLALQRKVASSTQNQALSAVLFLFRDTLKVDVGEGKKCQPMNFRKASSGLVHYFRGYPLRRWNLALSCSPL